MARNTHERGKKRPTCIFEYAYVIVFLLRLPAFTLEAA